MGPRSRDWCLYRRKDRGLDREAQAHREEGCEEMEAEVGVSTHHGRPGLAGSQQQLRRDEERFFPRGSRGGMALSALWFQRLDSRAAGEYISVGLSHPTSGALLQWPQETKTE